MSDLLGFGGPTFDVPEIKVPSTSPSLTIPAMKDPVQTLKLDIKFEAAQLKVDAITPSSLQRLVQSFTDTIREHKEQHLLVKFQKREQENSRLLQKIKAEMERGRWQRALAILDRLPAVDPPGEPAYLRAICLVMLRQFKEALALASYGAQHCDQSEMRAVFQSLEQQIQVTVVNLPLIEAREYMMEGSFFHAISAFDEYLHRNPRRPDVLYLKAICHLYLGDLDGIRKAGQRALLLLPEPKLAHAIKSLVAAAELGAALAQAQQHMEQGHFRQAIQILQNPLCGSDPTAKVLKIICHIRVGEVRQAEEMIRNLEKLDRSPTAAQIVVGLRQQIAEAENFAVIHRAMEAMKAQNWAEAAQLFQQVETSIGESAHEEPTLQFYIAVTRLRAGDLNSARVALDRSRKNSNNKKLNKQLDQLKAVLDKQEKNAPMQRVIDAMQNNSWDTALGQLRTILRSNNKDANAYYHLALCHFQMVGQLVHLDGNGASEHFRDGLAALSNAGRNCGWGTDKQLKQAIAALRSQVRG